MYFFLAIVVLAILTHAAGFTADTLGVGSVGSGLASTLSGSGNKSGTKGSFKFGTTSFQLT
jgi:hypothetical protein